MKFKTLVLGTFLLLAMLGASVLVGSGAARAQDNGFYVAGDLGYHWPDRMDTNVVGSGPKWTWNLTDNGAGFLRLGYGFDSSWRVELEGGDRPANLSAIRADVYFPLALVPAGGIPLSGVGGHIDATTLMANVIYDVPLGLPVQPFIGGGVGLVHTAVTAQGVFPFCAVCARPVICFPVCSVNLKVNDSSDKFGWQGIAGVSLSLAPQWTLDATYRYVRANGVAWSTSGGGGFFLPGQFRGDYSDSSVTLGIRHSFGG